MNAAEENMHVQMLGDLHVKKIKLNSMKRKQKKRSTVTHALVHLESKHNWCPL